MSPRQVLHHGRVALALHGLRDGDGPPLLLLHALGGSSADWGDAADAWPGPVRALDFSGHGASDRLPGRSYAPEIHAAEADVALAQLEARGPVHLAGAGLGAYVALLLAGARADRIGGALLLPGEGLRGGGALPGDLGPEARSEWRAEVSAPAPDPHDPGPDLLVRRCGRDIRPGYYVEEFARAAGRLLVAEAPDEPPWLGVVRRHGAVEPAPRDARAALAELAPRGLL